MPAKRSRSPSLSPSAASPTKLCLICGGLARKTGNQHYYGFFLDPTGEFCDADEFVPKSANFRLDGFVYTLDLSAVNSSQMAVFEKGELQKAPNMLGIKHAPSAVPTPDGKILVFSNNIFVEHEYCDMIDFEVYDPMTKSWSKLPQLCRPSDMKDDFILVYGSGFLNESLFFITTSIGRYAFDFNEHCWQEHILEGMFEGEFVHNFLLVGNEFYLSYDDIRRSSDRRIVTANPSPLPFPDSVYQREYSDSFVEVSSAVALLDFVADEEFRFCLAQTAVDGEYQSYLTFNICRGDLAKYRADQLQQGDCAQLCLAKVFSFRFIAQMEPLSIFRTLGMLPMGEGTNRIGACILFPDISFHKNVKKL